MTLGVKWNLWRKEPHACRFIDNRLPQERIQSFMGIWTRSNLLILLQVAPKRCGHTVGKSVVDRDEAYRRIKVNNIYGIFDNLLLLFGPEFGDMIYRKQVLIGFWLIHLLGSSWCPQWRFWYCDSCTDWLKGIIGIRWGHRAMQNVPQTWVIIAYHLYLYFDFPSW